MNKKDFPALYKKELVESLTEDFLKKTTIEQVNDFLEIEGLNNEIQEKLRKQRSFLLFKELPKSTFEHIGTGALEAYLKDGSMEFITVENLQAIPPAILRDINPEILAVGLGNHVQDLTEEQAKKLTAQQINTFSEAQAKSLKTLPDLPVFKNLNKDRAFLISVRFIKNIEKDEELSDHLDALIKSELEPNPFNIVSILDSHKNEAFQKYAIEVFLSFLNEKNLNNDATKKNIIENLKPYLHLIPPYSIQWISIKHLEPEDFAGALNDKQRAALQKEQIAEIKKEHLHKLSDNQLHKFTSEQLLYLMQLPSYTFNFDEPLKNKIHTIAFTRRAADIKETDLVELDGDHLREFFRSGFINYLSAEKFKFIPAEAFAELKPADFSHIDLDHFKLIRGNKFEQLQVDVVYRFTREQVLALDPASQVAFLNGLNLGVLPFLDQMRDEQIRGISPEALENLSSDDRARIMSLVEAAKSRDIPVEFIQQLVLVEPFFVGTPPSNIVRLDTMTRDQVQAMNVPALQAVNPALFRNIKLDSFKKFSDIQLQNLTAEQIGYLSKDIYKYLLDEKSDLLRLHQLNGFSPELALLDESDQAKFVSLRERQKFVQFLGNRKIEELTAVELKYLFEKDLMQFVLPEEMHKFNSVEFSKVNPQFFSKLEPNQILGLSRNVFERITSSHLNHLSSSDGFEKYVNWLSKEQIEGLNDQFLDRIRPKQMFHIGGRHLNMFTVDQIRHFSSLQLSHVNPNELEVVELAPDKKDLILTRQNEHPRAHIHLESTPEQISRVYADPAQLAFSEAEIIRDELYEKLQNKKLAQSKLIKTDLQSKREGFGLTAVEQQFADPKQPIYTQKTGTVVSSFGSTLPYDEEGFRAEMLSEHMSMEQYAANDGKQVVIVSASHSEDHNQDGSQAATETDNAYITSISTRLGEEGLQPDESLAPVTLDATLDAHDTIHQYKKIPAKTEHCGVVVVKAPDGTVTVDGSSIGSMGAFLKRGNQYIPLTKIQEPGLPYALGKTETPHLGNFTYFSATATTDDSLLILNPAALKSLTPIYHALTPREALKRKMDAFTAEEQALIKNEEIFNKLDAWHAAQPDPNIANLIKRLEDAFVVSILEQIDEISKRTNTAFSEKLIELCTRLPNHLEALSEQGIPFKNIPPGTFFEYKGRGRMAKGLADNFSCTEIAFTRD